MKIVKKLCGFVVTLSMVLSLSGVVPTPVLAEESIDQITEDQNVTQTPDEGTENNPGTGDQPPVAEEGDTETPPTDEEVVEEPVIEEPTTPESENTTDVLADGDVAKIGNDFYSSIDDAIEAAADGGTITLLSDVTAKETFYKSLTFTGGHTLNMDVYGWRFNGNLIFDNANFNITTDSDSPVANNGEAQRWFTMVLSGSLTAKNNANVTFDFDSDSGTNCAIYANNGANIKVETQSNLSIYGHNTRGVTGQAIQSDTSGGSSISVSGGSTFLIDGTNRGYVNSPKISVSDSTFTVQNCTNNASNGGLFTATNSTINYLNNSVLGLQSTGLNSVNSIFNLKNNGYSGLILLGESSFDGTSKVYIDNNCITSYAYGAFLCGAKTTFEKGSILEVTNNYANGIRVLKGKIAWSGDCDGELHAYGASVKIINNIADRDSSSSEDYGGDSKGGGLWNTGRTILPSNALIYNNSASTVGDDIYNGNNATLQISQPATGQTLTADHDDTNEDQAITNWFYDGANPDYDGKLGHAGIKARWDMDSYVKLFTYNDNTKTITDEIGLKAAYAPTTTFTPIDLTMYVGGEGYENVDSVADNDKKNGFPEPGYYVTLPKEINDAIQSDGQPVDLSETTNDFSFGYTYNVPDSNEVRHWKMTKYTDADGSESTKDGNYVYSLALADGRKPTLRVIDDAGNIQTNANFDLTNAVNKVYTTMVGSVEGDSFTSGEINESKSLTANVQTDTIDVDFDRTVIATGKLYVRGVVNVTDENLTTSIQKEGTEPKAGVPMATVPEGTTFYINGEEGLEIQKNADPSLLYDDILPEGTDANNDRRIGWLKDKAEQLCDQYDLLEQAGITNPQYSFKYMDIVDQNNGNVVLKADKNVTVYMPYPEGVDKDTSIIVLHYKDLNRDMTYDDVQSAIMNCEMEKMTVTQLDDHIEFETTSFSPFVVIWGTDEAGEIVKNKDRADTGLFQNAPLYIALMTACASLVAIITIKRRIDAK